MESIGVCVVLTLVFAHGPLTRDVPRDTDVMVVGSRLPSCALPY